MPSRTSRHFLTIALAALPLVLASADAFAKSSHARSRNAAARGAMSSALVSGAMGSGTMMLNGPTGYNYPPYAYPTSRGVLLDNTAGWGNVGAF